MNNIKKYRDLIYSLIILLLMISVGFKENGLQKALYETKESNNKRAKLDSLYNGLVIKNNELEKIILRHNELTLLYKSGNRITQKIESGGTVSITTKDDSIVLDQEGLDSLLDANGATTNEDAIVVKLKNNSFRFIPQIEFGITSQLRGNIGLRLSYANIKRLDFGTDMGTGGVGGSLAYRLPYIDNCRWSHGIITRNMKDWHYVTNLSIDLK